MTDRVAKGTWVEIHRILLPAGERAPHVPKDTAGVPLELRVKGLLAEPAAVGAQVEVITAAGRRLHGTLVEINPAYTHGFGAPIPELTPIGSEARAILRQRGQGR